VDAMITSLSFVASAINLESSVKHKVEVPRIILQVGIPLIITEGIAYTLKEYLANRTNVEAEKNKR